ncbi:MAG: phage tail tape measure protein [Prevotellaceae bacterium]|nr:phage tail tape measure protein [Prevotellaceae bacterium]
MAKFTTQAEATVTLNGKQAEIMLNTLKNSAEKLRKQIVEIKKTDPNNPNLKKMNNELKALETSAAKVKKTTFDYAQVLNNLKDSSLKQLQKTKQILLNQVKGLKNGTEAWIDKTKELRKVDAQINKMNKALRENKRTMTDVADFFTKWYGAFTMLTASISTINGMLSKFRDAAAKMSDAYADVMKTTGMTTNEVKDLNEAFKKMDTRTSREELNKLARDAGKLGIAKEDVLGFVEAGNQINVALGEDLGDDAIKNIGKIIQVFKKSQEDLQGMDLKNQMLSVGSAINSLGQSSTASEQYLVDFSQRLGGVAAQAGISIQNILGYASALDQSGQAVEMSATALQKFIMSMLEKPEEFARIAGIEIKKFNELLSTDTNEAIKTVLSALGDKGGFQQLIPIFKEMGLDGARAVSVLSSLATNIEAVEIAQKISNDEFTKAISLTNEYAIRNNTLQGKIEKARQKVQDMREEIGQKLQSAMLKTSQIGMNLISLLMKTPKEIYILIAALVAVQLRLVALKTLTKTWTAIVNAAKVAKTGLTAAMHLFTGSTVAAKAAWQKLNTAMKANFIIMAAAAIYGLVKGIISLISKTDAATKAYKDFRVELTKEKGTADALFESLKKANEGSELRKSLIQKINEKYGEYLGYLLDEKSSLDEIAAAQQIVNNKMETNYALKHKTKAEDDIREKYSKKKEDALEDIRATVSSDKLVTKSKDRFNISENDVGDEFAQMYVKEILRIFSQENSYTATANHKDKIFLNPESLKELNINVGSLYKSGTAVQKKLKEYIAYVLQEAAELDAINKKFALVLPEPSNKAPTDSEAAAATAAEEERRKAEEEKRKAEEERRKAAAAEREKEREERFKKMLERLETEQREERNLQARAYMQEKIDREEYYASVEAIDYIALTKRKALYESFGKDTSEIDAQIAGVWIKIMEDARKKAKEVDEEFKKWAEKVKKESDLTGETEKAESDVAKGFEDDFMKKVEDAERLRADFQKENILERMRAELDALDELHEAGLISEEEYEKARRNIMMASYKKVYDYYSSTFSGMIGAMQDAEVSKVEADEQKKLAALQNRRDQGLIAEEEYNAEKEKIERDAAQKKLDIEKKYADVNFAIKVADIIANTATAIMTAFSQLGPIAGAVAAVMLGATGLAQIAAANAERQKVKSMTLDSASTGSSAPPPQRVVLSGVEEGGYTDVERKQDGKIFSARKRKQRGYAGEPTVLIGEAGAEFVANAEAVKNPTIKPVLDLINIAQQNGSISSINLPKLINSTYAVKGYEGGGYTSTPTNSAQPAAATDSSEMIAVMREVRDLLSYLKINGVDAWVLLSQLQKQQAILEKSEKLGSRK